MEEEVVAQAAQTTAEQSNWIYQAFHDGGNTMFAIAFVGILVTILIIERFMTLRKLSVDKDDFNEKLFGMILRGDVRQAVTFCDSKPTPLTSTLKSGLVQVMNGRPDEEVQVAMDGSVLRETPKIEGWTGFLAVFGNVATLLGLLGTIIGLITGFGGVSEADPAQRSEILSMGISHALNCTAFGLAVAIPALVFYGYFQIRVSRTLNDMVESSMGLMNLVVSNRDKLKRITMAHIDNGDDREVNAELNIVPFIDLMSVCIIFLLLTAVWTQVSMIQIGASVYGKRTDTENPPPPRPTVMLKVEVRESGFRVLVGRNSVSIPKAEGEFDQRTLIVELKKVKDKYPDKEDAMIAVGNDMKYEDLIMGMDSLLLTGFPEVAVQSGGI